MCLTNFVSFPLDDIQFRVDIIILYGSYEHNKYHYMHLKIMEDSIYKIQRTLHFQNEKQSENKVMTTYGNNKHMDSKAYETEE